MTPDRKRLVMWAGGGAAVVAAGFIGLLVRSDAEAIGNADKLHASYIKLYHPDKPEGFAIDQARNELRDNGAKQAAELATAEGSLAPPLASAYLVESLSEAAAQVTADYAALRQLEARTRIGIPSTLPFESGLDADAKTRSRQLASLALIRLAVQTCMNAGVKRVANVLPGQPFASPDGAYAVFVCDLDVEGDWAATSRLIAAFAQADGRGLGLRAVEVTSGADKPLRARLSVAMTTANRSAWALQALPAAAPTAAAGASGGGDTGGGGSRLRRLGGTRP